VIRCFCPSCSHMLEVPDSEAGSKRPCDLCGQRLQVPIYPRNKTILAGLTPPEPVPVLEEEPQDTSGPAFRCPHCGTSHPPAVITSVSTTGWTLFGVGVALFFPVACLHPLAGLVIAFPFACIGLLLREHWEVCVRCGRRIRPMG
jgi:hypothetical protein